MDIRELSIGLFCDSIVSQIPAQVLNSPSGLKVIKPITKKNTEAMHRIGHPQFDKIVDLVSSSWKEIQESSQMEVAVSLIFQTLLEREPWLIKKYKLNTKHIDKVLARFKAQGNIFQSKRAVTLMLNALDENIARATYNYNKEKL